MWSGPHHAHCYALLDTHCAAGGKRERFVVRAAALQVKDHSVQRNGLTDSGTGALARALAAADPTDRPTLERLHLNRHPGIGCATAAALAAAPLQSLSKLTMSHGGALH